MSPGVDGHVSLAPGLYSVHMQQTLFDLEAYPPTHNDPGHSRKKEKVPDMRKKETIILPGPKPNKDQGHFYELYDEARVTGNPNSRRALAGKYTEEIVCSALQLEHLNDDATCDVCPDAKWDNPLTYFEIKNLKGRTTIPIYVKRRENEEAVNTRVAPLYYAVLRHRSNFSDAKTVRDIYRSIAETAEAIYVLRFEDIMRYTDRPPDKEYTDEDDSECPAGWASRGYNRGYWRMSTKQFDDDCKLFDNVFFEARGFTGLVKLYTAEGVSIQRKQKPSHRKKKNGRNKRKNQKGK